MQSAAGLTTASNPYAPAGYKVHEDVGWVVPVENPGIFVFNNIDGSVALLDKNPIDVEIDIRGEVCPYTFVKSKLAIEEMDGGEILRVVVNHFPATENVPRSMKLEGHQVLRIEQLNEADWEIVVQKISGE